MSKAILGQFATERPGTGTAVAYHLEPKNKVSVPEGMDLSKATSILNEAAMAEQERQDFVRTFKFRPWDGAAALHRVMEKYFGTTGRGVAIKTFFGEIPPKMIEIEVAFGETIQVPWGRLEFAAFEGIIDLGGSNDEEYGELFQLKINCPKKYQTAVSGFFHLLEKELQEGSIYKGAAIRGTDQPRFLPLTTDDSIVYNQSVYDSLETSVWGVIKNAELLRDLNIKTDPKVLLHGPYGTGKSETGRLTARIAVDHKWTFIAFNSGKSSQSDLEKTLQTARLLAPAVVFIEDVDLYANGDADERQQSRMLEMFDGISSKGHEVLVLMTSNKPAAFSKGMLRAGRINKMIEIGSLNKEATERLIRNVNSGHLQEDLDFEQIWEACKGYEPAFLRQTFDDARQSAAIRHAADLRSKGTYNLSRAREFKLGTVDFVTAAQLMRPQHKAHDDAAEASHKVHIEDLLRDTVSTLFTDRLTLANEQIGTIEVELIPAAERVG
jgi:transitional endoplasmic reticulum ATPase